MSREDIEALMSNEGIRLGFEEWAEDKNIDMSFDFFFQSGANPYTENDARLAYDIWCSAIHYAYKSPDPDSTKE